NGLVTDVLKPVAKLYFHDHSFFRPRIAIPGLYSIQRHSELAAGRHRNALYQFEEDLLQVTRLRAKKLRVLLPEEGFANRPILLLEKQALKLQRPPRFQNVDAEGRLGLGLHLDPLCLISAHVYRNSSSPSIHLDF